MQFKLARAGVKTFAGVIMSAAVLGGMSANAFAERLIKVATEPTFPPFEFVNTQTGEVSGFEMDLVRAVGKELGAKIEFQVLSFDAIIPAMLSGTVEMGAAGFSITEERKKTWDFSTPYYTDYVSVLVEDSTGIKGLADLKDKVVGVSSGSTSARALVKAMIDEGVLDGANFDADTFNADTWKDGISFRQYDDYPAISTALSAGEVQGFCVDKSILAIYKTEGRSYIDAEFSPQEYGVATKKGSDFSTVCDDLIKGWLADGTIDQLIKDNGLG